MTDSNNTYDNIASAITSGDKGMARDHRADANIAAADAYATSLKPVMSELLATKSDCTHIATSYGWCLTDLARELNQRGILTRTGKHFRAMTVKRLLDRMPDVVDAVIAANNAKSTAAFKQLFGVDAPASATEAIAGMNKLSTATGNTPTA